MTVYFTINIENCLQSEGFLKYMEKFCETKMCDRMCVERYHINIIIIAYKSLKEEKKAEFVHGLFGHIKNSSEFY